MAESTSAARPYARAAFEQAQADKRGLRKWSELLAVAAMIAEDPAVRRLLASPRVAAQDKGELFLDICGNLLGEDKLPEEGRNFIKLLAENRRLPLLPAIAEQFERLRAEAERTLHAELITALPISDGQRDKIAAALKARLDREVVLEVKVDESLLGGAIIRAGDMVIDGSARGQLHKLATVLSQ
ncbi:MAG TPA: F0F1 ATP synthase subunit delta [Candidatus Competibacteraceae bacterium]|nr:F0F1 ATP synthase subunit delta [Candidatus Competibacteraceae bacterium]